MMSRTPKLAAVAVLAAFSGLALQVHAQETVELDEVKVTAGRVEQELMDVNMSVSVITQEEIRSHLRTVENPSKDEMYAYWKLDEGEGTTLKDSSGNGRDLTVPEGTEVAWGAELED